MALKPKPKRFHRLYYARDPKSVGGHLTLQLIVGGKVEEPFKRLAARSGQAGHTGTSWDPGLSPIPYTPKGRCWYLSTKVGILQMEPRGTEFFQIGSSQQNTGVITDGLHTRRLIGLHRENSKPGSAGCIVVVNKQDADELFAYLKAQYPDEPYIELIVC